MTRTLTFVLLLFLSFAVSAQESIRRGKVTDENNQPMPGVGVVVPGTLNGVITDAEGNYSISVTPGQQLQFSFLGYKTENVTIGEATVINVSMKTDSQIMESAVVTALGIKRDEKSIGYSAQKVGEETFANSSAATNWLSGLSGQVAGLNIAQSNSGPGGSARVTLRGESSADLSNNTALFVIDGVPMFNSATTSDAGGDGTVYAIDYGDGTGDVNPEDIESITVLKSSANSKELSAKQESTSVLISAGKFIPLHSMIFHTLNIKTK